MTDQTLRFQLTRASETRAGVTPSMQQVLTRPAPRRSLIWPGAIALAATGVLALIVIQNLPGREAYQPASKIEPDLYVLAEETERSDWLTRSRSNSPNQIPRSDWLLTGAQASMQSYLSDQLMPDDRRVSGAYVLVDATGKPLTDPNKPNIIYVIERTTP